MIKKQVSLLAFNTFGIDVKADYFAEYGSVSELNMIFESPLAKTNKLLAVGCGSNLLFTSDFKGMILHSAMRFIKVEKEDDHFIHLRAGAGVNWDDFVSYCVNNGWGGIENLSLIPGEVGASAVQNIGAYGVEVKDVIVEVEAFEIKTGQLKVFSADMCNYSYRESIFKNKLKGQYLITSVVFRLEKNPVFRLNYQHLEQEVLARGGINLKNIRKAIIAIRTEKLPDPVKIGNAGSFFMNPVISHEHFDQLKIEYPDMPHYVISSQEVKIPAAWLIDQCGWKGKRVGRVGVHDKQPLVLVNVGGATGNEIVDLANKIQDSVNKKFNIQLLPEVNYIS